MIFYVGVPNVEAALQKAESLGGTRRMGPEKNPGADLVVGHFSDPEGLDRACRASITACKARIFPKSIFFNFLYAKAIVRLRK